jgi:hypothetical protein
MSISNERRAFDKPGAKSVTAHRPLGGAAVARVEKRSALSRPTAILSSPAVHRGVVRCGTTDGNLHAPE